jgi:hypothetical protein
MAYQATTKYPRNFFDEMGNFVHGRLADACDLFALFILGLCVVMAGSVPSFFVSRNVLAASLAAPALCYLLVSRSLRRREGVGYERVFIALAVASAGMWVFETLAYFAWVESGEMLGESLLTFNINPVGRGKPFPVLWALIMVAAMFAGYKHMRLTRWFYVTLAAAVAMLALWIAVGHPSHDQPWRSPDAIVLINLIPSAFGHPSGPADPGWAFIVFWGGLLTSAVKLIVGVLPATLFVHNFRRAPASSHPDDVLAKLGKWITAAWRKITRQDASIQTGGTGLEGRDRRAD